LLYIGTDLPVNQVQLDSNSDGKMGGDSIPH